MFTDRLTNKQSNTTIEIDWKSDSSSKNKEISKNNNTKETNRNVQLTEKTMRLRNRETKKQRY